MRPLAPGQAAIIVLGMLAVVFGGASWKLGFWVHGGPGPGLLPAAAAALLLASVAVLFRAKSLAAEDAAFSPTAVAGFAMLCAYGASLPWGGFVVPSLLFAVLWMRLLHGRGLVAAVVASGLIVGAVALLFRGALAVPIPLWPEFP